MFHMGGSYGSICLFTGFTCQEKPVKVQHTLNGSLGEHREHFA